MWHICRMNMICLQNEYDIFAEWIWYICGINVTHWQSECDIFAEWIWYVCRMNMIYWQNEYDIFAEWIWYICGINRAPESCGRLTANCTNLIQGVPYRILLYEIFLFPEANRDLERCGWFTPSSTDFRESVVHHISSTNLIQSVPHRKLLHDMFPGANRDLERYSWLTQSISDFRENVLHYEEKVFFIIKYFQELPRSRLGRCVVTNRDPPKSRLSTHT